MDSLNPLATPNTQSPTFPAPPTPSNHLQTTSSFPPPTTLSPSRSHPSLPAITSHITSHFLSSWPGLSASPKAAAQFKKSKIALYTALVFPDEEIEEGKLAIVTEIVAMVILVDDWLDTVGDDMEEEIVRGLEGVYGRLFNTEEAQDKRENGKNDISFTETNGHADAGLEDEDVKRALPVAESENRTLPSHISIVDHAFNPEKGSTSRPTKDTQAVQKQIICLHESLWRRLIVMSPLFARAISKAHIRLSRAQTSKLRGTHTRVDEYLAFRYTEAGMKLAEVAQYFLVGAEGLAKEALAEKESDSAIEKGDADCKIRGHLGELMENTDIAKALQALRDCEVLASKHLLLINDVVSYDREVKALESLNHSQTQMKKDIGNAEVAMVSAIPLVMNDFGLDAQGAKAVIWTTVRQVERYFRVKRVGGLKAIEKFEAGEVQIGSDQKLMGEVKRVLFGLEARMAGSEQWHYETGRYYV